MKSSFVIPLFERYARERGIEICIEPEHRFVAQLTLPDGKKRYVSTHIDCVDGAGATEIARDKTYALFFLKKMGYSVPEGRAFFSQGYADYLGSDRTATAAWQYVCEIGLPVILKPNSKSQGRGVWKIHSQQEFEAATRDLDAWVDIYRIERFCEGRDYRIVVYDSSVVCAYERIPLSICGNGNSTVKELIEEKEQSFRQINRSIAIDSHDRRIQWSLKRNALSLDAILEQGRMFMLLSNANLSSGGDIRDVINSINASYTQVARLCARDMGLQLCGIDLLIDGDGTDEKASTIIEVNAGPGLAHYASLGPDQWTRVEAMYRKIFEGL